MSAERDDARAVRAPKLSIEVDASDGESDNSTHTSRSARVSADRAAPDQEMQDSEELRGAVGFIKGLGAELWRYAEGHPFTVLYAFVGLVLAVLILTIGFWDTLIIAAFVAVGAVIGQIRDGDDGIINFFHRLIHGGR